MEVVDDEHEVFDEFLALRREMIMEDYPGGEMMNELLITDNTTTTQNNMNDFEDINPVSVFQNQIPFVPTDQHYMLSSASLIPQQQQQHISSSSSQSNMNMGCSFDSALDPYYRDGFFSSSAPPQDFAFSSNSDYRTGGGGLFPLMEDEDYHELGQVCRNICSSDHSIRGVDHDEGVIKPEYSYMNSNNKMLTGVPSTTDHDQMGLMFGGAGRESRIKHSCAGGKKRLDGQPSKNLMAERRRRKRLNDRLSMLRSVVPRISKMDRTSILGDTIDYTKELLARIKGLQAEIDLKSEGCSSSSSSSSSNHLSLLGIFNQIEQNQGLVRNTPRFDVERRDGDQTSIDMCCSSKPGLLLSTISTIESLGLEIQQCVITCFNDFGMQASCNSQDVDQSRSPEDIKQALLRNAGYGGRCM